MINHIGMINHGGQGRLDSGFSTNILSQEILRMSRLGVSVCPMYWGGLGSSPCGSFGAPRGGFADAERYARCTLDRALDGCCRLHFYSFLRSFVLAAFAGENGEILEFPKVIILFLVILVGAPTKT